MTADRRSFGALLKRHRLAVGLTHERLAERSTLSVRAISDLERGVSRRPHPETVVLLAEALCLSPDERAGFVSAARQPVGQDSTARTTRNLPVQLASFVGREREMRALRGLLRRRDVRLLTLTGPGGSGKTRLAIEVAGDLVDADLEGTVFVALASVVGVDDVAMAVARAVGVSDTDARTAVSSAIERIGDRRVLLLLDNFEHVLAATPLVLDLLRACSGLKLLVTSRAALRLTGEQEFPVAPLVVPDVEHLPSAADLTANPSVALLLDRVTRVRPDFVLTDENAAAVATLCAQLDGLPLAIELAAARLKLMSPAMLLDRLEHGPTGSRLRLLRSGARDLPERQRTMHETITWSYNLLSADEQRLLRQLAVFAGGCTLEAAMAVCESDSRKEREADLLDRLASLVDNSLVHQAEDSTGESRFTMLETIREFALEKLDAHGETAELYQRHATYYLAIVEETGALLFAGSRERVRVAADQDNIQAALRWLVLHG